MRYERSLRPPVTFLAHHAFPACPGLHSDPRYALILRPGQWGKPLTRLSLQVSTLWRRRSQYDGPRLLSQSGISAVSLRRCRLLVYH